MLEHYVPLPIGGIYYKFMPPALIPDNACQMAVNMDFQTGKGFVTRDGVGHVNTLPGPVDFLGGFVKFNGQTKIVASASGQMFALDTDGGFNQELGAFTSSTGNPISYTNFTDKLLLVNRTNKLKTWSGNSGDLLVDVPKAMPARHVRTLGAYVLLLNTVEDGNEVPQRVRWSAPGDLGDWTGPGSGFLDLVDTPDPIMNGLMYGGSFVVYKRNSVIILDLVGGGSSTFRVTSAYTKSGMISYRGLVDLGDSHIFLGHDNFYMFTGSPHLEPIGDPIWKLIQERGWWSRMEQAHAVHDVYNHKAVFYVPMHGASGWGVFNYDYRLGIWSYYEYPFAVLNSLYTIEHGNFLSSGSSVGKTSGDYMTDIGSPITSKWTSKKFILEGDSPQPSKYKRFMGVDIEVEGGNIAGTLFYGNKVYEQITFPEKTFYPPTNNNTHVAEIDFDVSGKHAVFEITSNGGEHKLSVRGFKIRYEEGGV